MSDNPLYDDTSYPQPDDNGAASEPAPFIEEPPIALDDTQPKAPVRVESTPDAVYRALAAEEPPVQPMIDTAEGPAHGGTPARGLLLALVMLGTVCLCLTLVSFAGIAGYRDGLATNDVKITQTLATGIAEQYATGVADLNQGYAELAAARFEWIVETVQAPPAYALDSAQRLATARAISSYTPTSPPVATATPEPSATPTIGPTPEPSLAPSATLNPMQDPAYFYNQAATAMTVLHYEDAIEWLDALRALDPTHRSAETTAMLRQALTEQGRIYLRGQNKDGEDQLARGVLLIYRAQELGPVEPSTLLGEAIFVERYINARSYVAGGQYAAALPVLLDLCDENCEWGYPNVDPLTVRELLEQAQNSAQ
jgi:hypothetical protein